MVSIKDKNDDVFEDNYNIEDIKKKYRVSFIKCLNNVGYCPTYIQTNILYLHPNANEYKGGIVPKNILKTTIDNNHLRGDTAWKPGRDRIALSERDIQINKIKGKLNKIDFNNQDKILPEVISIITEDILDEIVLFIYDKGIWDEKFRNIITNLCILLKEKYDNIVGMLTDKFIVEFSGIINEDDDDEFIIKNTKKRLGSVLFLSNLFENNIISVVFIIKSIDLLLSYENMSTDTLTINYYNIIHAGELLKNAILFTNKNIDKVKLQDSPSIKHVDFSNYINIIKDVYNTKKLSGSSKIKLENILAILNE